MSNIINICTIFSNIAEYCPILSCIVTYWSSDYFNFSPVLSELWYCKEHSDIVLYCQKCPNIVRHRLRLCSIDQYCPVAPCLNIFQLNVLGFMDGYGIYKIMWLLPILSIIFECCSMDIFYFKIDISSMIDNLFRLLLYIDKVLSNIVRSQLTSSE